MPRSVQGESRTSAAGFGRPASAACSASVEREVAAGRVARDDDPLRRVALVEQVAVGGERVLDRRGQRRDGRQAVVEREHRQAGDVRDARDEVAVRARRAEHVAAAVEVEDDGAVVAVGRRRRARAARAPTRPAGRRRAGARRRCPRRTGTRRLGGSVARCSIRTPRGVIRQLRATGIHVRRSARSSATVCRLAGANVRAVRFGRETSSGAPDVMPLTVAATRAIAGSRFHPPRPARALVASDPLRRRSSVG